MKIKTKKNAYTKIFLKRCFIMYNFTEVFKQPSFKIYSRKKIFKIVKLFVIVYIKFNFKTKLLLIFNLILFDKRVFGFCFGFFLPYHVFYYLFGFGRSGIFSSVKLKQRMSLDVELLKAVEFFDVSALMRRGFTVSSREEVRLQKAEQEGFGFLSKQPLLSALETRQMILERKVTEEYGNLDNINEENKIPYNRLSIFGHKSNEVYRIKIHGYLLSLIDYLFITHPFAKDSGYELLISVIANEDISFFFGVIELFFYIRIDINGSIIDVTHDEKTSLAALALGLCIDRDCGDFRYWGEFIRYFRFFEYVFNKGLHTHSSFNLVKFFHATIFFGNEEVDLWMFLHKLLVLNNCDDPCYFRTARLKQKFQEYNICLIDIDVDLDTSTDI